MENKIFYIFLYFLIITVGITFKGVMYRWSFKQIIIAIVVFYILSVLFILGKNHLFS